MIKKMSFGIGLGMAAFLGGFVVNQQLSHDSSKIGIHIAGSPIIYTKEEMSATANLILSGEVMEVLPARWNTGNGEQPEEITGDFTIYHDVIIKPKKVYKGDTSKENVTVRVYEGKIPGGMMVESEQEPEFTKEENVLLFLAYDDGHYNTAKSQDFYVTVGMFQGKYTLKGTSVKNKKEKLDVENLENTIEKHKKDRKPSWQEKEPGFEP